MYINKHFFTYCVLSWQPFHAYFLHWNSRSTSEVNDYRLFNTYQHVIRDALFCNSFSRILAKSSNAKLELLKTQTLRGEMGFRKIHLQLSSWVKLELLGCVEIESVISYLINGIFMPCQSSKEPLKKRHTVLENHQKCLIFTLPKKFLSGEKIQIFWR